MKTVDPTVAALQTALAAEHVAAYGYGVLGPRLIGQQRATATQLWTAHRARRDRLRAYLTTAGAKPVAAKAAYKLPSPVNSAHSAAQLAGTIEEGVAAAYIALAGSAKPELRRYAALAMQEATVRALRWKGGSPPAFPGMSTAALRPLPEQ